MKQTLFTLSALEANLLQFHRPETDADNQRLLNHLLHAMKTQDTIHYRHPLNCAMNLYRKILHTDTKNRLTHCISFLIKNIDDLNRNLPEAIEPLTQEMVLNSIGEDEKGKELMGIVSQVFAAESENNQTKAQAEKTPEERPESGDQGPTLS